MVFRLISYVAIMIVGKNGQYSHVPNVVQAYRRVLSKDVILQLVCMGHMTARKYGRSDDTAMIYCHSHGSDADLFLYTMRQAQNWLRCLAIKSGFTKCAKHTLKSWLQDFATMALMTARTSEVETLLS